MSTDGNISCMYCEAHNHSYNNMSKLAWSSELRIRSDCRKPPDFDYFEMHLNSSKYNSAFGFCDFYSSIITIHSMMFTGFNMQRHSPSAISLFTTCQYGGLFVIKSNTTEYLKLCADVRGSFTFPINGFVTRNNRQAFEEIVFTTFLGYSSGSIHLTAVRDYACTGLNVAISRGPSCNNSVTIWDDLYWNCACLLVRTTANSRIIVLICGL